MSKDSTRLFDSAPIPEAVMKNVIPSIIAMLMVLIYNLADTLFIGLTHDDLQVAAASFAMPVFLLFMAFGTLFGMGGTSVISRALGEGRPEYAKKVSSFCMWSCIAIGLVFSVSLLVFMNGILNVIGTSADTVDYTWSYLSIVALCAPFALISNCFSNVIRAEGQSTKAMTGVLIGNLLNVILDPIMILWLDWGIKGAAIATVIGNVVAAMYYLIYFLRGKSSLSIRLKDFSVKDKIFTGVLSIGLAASLGPIMMSVSQIIANSLLSAYGDMAVAAYGVSLKVTMIVALISIGLGQGIQPLLGFCVGAKYKQRFKDAIKYSIGFALILGIALVAICYLFSGAIVSVFLTDATAYENGVTFTRILLSTCWVFGVFFVLVNALQAMGAATASLVIAISRQGIIFIPCIFVLNAVLGMNGVIWTQPIVDAISVVLAFVFYLFTFRKCFSNEASTDTLPDSDIVCEPIES